MRTIKKIFNTTVSVKEGASRSVLRGIIQNDTLNEVNIRLSDGSKAFDYYGYTNIIFKVLKADGTSYIDSEGENVIATSPEDGIVTVILKGQATAAAGLCQSVIEIYVDGEKMTTARFNYEVFESLDVDEDAVSESQYPVFQNLLSDLSALEASIAEAEEKRVVAEAARDSAASGYVARARSSAAEAAEWAKQAKNIAGGNFAPDGYGLGASAVLLKDTDDLNNVWRNGFYYWNANPINAPFGYAVMSVTSATQNAFVQEITSYNTTVTASGYGNSKMRRVRLGDVVIEEWENPQMVLGVEYRTTERYNGRPVYAKRFDAGLFPSAGSVKEIDFTTGTESEGKIGNIVSVGGIAGTWTIPTDLYGGVITNDGKVYLTARVTSGNGVIYIGTASRDLTAVSAHVIVKYTKTTDT